MQAVPVMRTQGLAFVPVIRMPKDHRFLAVSFEPPRTVSCLADIKRHSVKVIVHKRYIKYGVFCAPLLVFLLILLFSKPRKTWEQEGRVSSPRVKTLADWATGSFVPITTNDDFKQKLESIPVLATNVTLTQTQVEELHESIHDFVLAYHVGTYEAYSKFRLPVKYNGASSRIIEFEKERLKKLFPDKDLQHEVPEVVNKEWWDYWDGLRDKAISPSLRLKYCTRCLQEVDIERGKIFVEQVTHLPKALNYYVTSFSNVGYSDSNPTFMFDPSPETLATKEGKVIIAVVSLIFKHPVDPPYPLYCRFYWVDSEKKWVPFELAGAYAQKTWVYIF